MKYFTPCLIINILFQLLIGCSMPAHQDNVPYPKILSLGYVNKGFEISVLDINSGKRQYITNSKLISPTSFSYCDKSNEIVYSAYIEMGEELIIWEPNHDPKLLTQGGNHFRYPKWSRDCSLLAVDSNKEVSQIYLFDPTSEEMRLLLPGYNGPSMNFSWSPDSQFGTILIPLYDDAKNISGYSLGIVNLNKSILEGQIPGNIDYSFSQVEWAKDSASFLFSAKRDSTFDIYDYDLKSRLDKPIVQTGLDDLNPVTSPDGRQFAFLQALPGNERFSIQLFDFSSQTITELVQAPAKITAILWLSDKQIVFSEYDQFKNRTSYVLLDIQSKNITQIADFDGMFMYSQWFLDKTSQ